MKTGYEMIAARLGREDMSIDEMIDEIDLLKDEKKWADYYHKRLVEAREKRYLPDSFSF